MEANVVKHLEGIQGYTHEQLLQECANLKRLYDNERVQNIELRRTNTAMSREYKRTVNKMKDLETQNADLQKLCSVLQSQNELLTRHHFGSHNEKLDALAAEEHDWVDPLSEDAEPVVPTEDVGEAAEAKLQEELLAKEAKPSPRNQFGKARTKITPTKRDFSKLPHINTFDIDPDELDKKYGVNQWQIISWHTKDKLHRISVLYYVEKCHAPVIKDMKTGRLVASPMPDVFYPGSPATCSLVAGIMYDSTVLAIPYYREEMDMANRGLILPRQDMANWVIRFSYSHLSVAYEYMHYLLTKCHYGQCDETWIQVLNEEGRKATTKSYVWVHTTSELDTIPPMVLFAYEPTRGAEHLTHFYGGFSGALSSDAYSAYQHFAKEKDEEVVSSGCFMHARRRFFEAFLTACSARMPEEKMMQLTEWQLIRRIAEIYAVEATLKDLSPEDRLVGRTVEVKPMVDAFFSTLKSLDAGAPSMAPKLKDAIQYSLTYQRELCQFLHDGRIPIDNGYCENAIRIYAQGRRNWLFCNTVSGATAKMVIYSLVETAKRNNANPLLYLTYLLDKTPDYMDLPFRDDRLVDLMPWSDQYKTYQEKQMGNLIGTAIPLSQPKPSYRRMRSEPESTKVQVAS